MLNQYQTKFYNLQLILLILVTGASFITGIQNEKYFETIILQKTLPLTGRHNFPAVFNGEDKIFLLGGFTYSGPQDEVLSYTLSTEDLEVVGHFPSKVSGGRAFVSRNGDIFYIIEGEDASPITVFKLRFDDPTPVVYSTINITYNNFDVVFDGNRTVYIIGGIDTSTGDISDEIIKIDVNNVEAPTEVVAHLPKPAHASSSVWVNGAAYIIAGGVGRDGNFGGDIRRFMPSNGTEKLQVKIASVGKPSTVVVGNVIYIIGGETWYDRERNCFTRFNTVSGQIEYFNIDLGSAWIDVASVYVKKTNRIYLFGGVDRGGKRSDEIRYIQLPKI